MKAKEYYEKYLIDATAETTEVKVWEVICAMVEEVPKIQAMRRAHSNSAMVAIIREQNQKWNALLKYNAVNPHLRLKRNGFVEIVKYNFSKVVPKEVLDQVLALFDGI